ncbi:MULTISPECIES: 6-phosphofructokinase [Nosocomiicoccus]|uniref:6-phosphofructokinase n=1 Tax=Nosocomiicoccus TaxID=489909 RepID=UPI00082D1BEC|nr:MULTISPECIES: 6-phosphofructokinase [Nosocomiicoccus]OFL46245.1 ATP-dependent 6-phosphofructokinase [Nosocomiicoccus sp. HMSC067E10]OFO55753.1 ATP-dependent 6-phosphofructokinase [Nosocomiicoccus sp. HMSC059G07]OFS63898.1 ATP-dependent 6-phosphofructokinase [Nosocomiicoccus sp. HMSC09A07]
MKRIAVLTSGGDAPGMNAAVRAVVRTSINRGLQVFGISHGFLGLIRGDIKRMELSDVGDIIQRGGTALYSARCNEFKDEEIQQMAVKILKEFEIEGLVVIGGDGTFRGAYALEKHGIKTIAIPATIDNDIPFTESSIGFDSALNTVVEAVDRIRDTATSHERTFIIEVMGRDSGMLALYSGIASGAESVLIPEVPYNINDVATKIKRGIERGKTHSIIIVAEGVMSAEKCSKLLSEQLNIESRISVLGHIQRGGRPSSKDRILASRFGYEAVNLLLEGQSGQMVYLTQNSIKHVDYDTVLNHEKKIDISLIDIINELSI